MYCAHSLYHCISDRSAELQGLWQCLPSGPQPEARHSQCSLPSHCPLPTAASLTSALCSFPVPAWYPLLRGSRWKPWLLLLRLEHFKTYQTLHKSQLWEQQKIYCLRSSNSIVAFIKHNELHSTVVCPTGGDWRKEDKSGLFWES